jgi:hypothetical protein
MSLPVDTPEVRDRWRQALNAYLERKARIEALRQALAEARAAGLRARQAKRRRTP